MAFYKLLLQGLEGMQIKYLVSILVLLVVGLPWAYSSFAKDETKDPGRVMVDKNGCLNCHFAEGDGGFIGPPLDGIGKYLSEEQIVDRLTSPKSTKPLRQRFPAPEEFMRHVKLSSNDATLVARYLRSIPETDLKASHPGLDVEKFLPKGFKFSPKEPDKFTQKGKKKFQSSGCLACHSVQGKGGRLAPALDGIGAYRSRAYIESRIAKGAIVMHASKEYKTSRFSMPPSQLSDAEVNQITDYLMTLPEIDLESKNTSK